MKPASEIINILLEVLGENANSFSKKLALPRSQTIYDLQSGKTKSISKNLIKKIESVYPSVDTWFLLTGDGDPINNQIKNTQPKLEAVPIRLADPKGFEATGERIYKLPDDSLIMQVPVIPYKAYASYLRGHSDPEFYEGLETMPVPVSQSHKGTYLIFEVGGESMLNPGSRHSIWPGEKIIGRDLRRDKWKYKLHINSTNCWVIVHRYEGIIVKEIIEHNVDNATITVHSWNPDKNEYPDYLISLNDVEQIFNVVDPFNKFG